MAKKVIESVQDEKDAKMYEFAFHLVPKMTEDEALKSFTDIKKLVEASGATIKNESSPALLNLAYQMELTVDAVKSKYNLAYFAWIILEANGTQVLLFTKEMKERTDILRHLLITTKNDSPITSQAVAQALSDEEEIDENTEGNQESEESKDDTKESEEKATESKEEVKEESEVVVNKESTQKADTKEVDDAIDKLTE